MLNGLRIVLFRFLREISNRVLFVEEFTVSEQLHVEQDDDVDVAYEVSFLLQDDEKVLHQYDHLQIPLLSLACKHATCHENVYLHDYDVHNSVHVSNPLRCYRHHLLHHRHRLLPSYPDEKCTRFLVSFLYFY